MPCLQYRCFRRVGVIAYALSRDSIVELRFHSSFTQSTQMQLTSILYENPLADIHRTDSSFPSLHLSQRSDSLSASSTYPRLLPCPLDPAPLRELVRGAPSLPLPHSTPPNRAWKRSTSAASSASVSPAPPSHPLENESAEVRLRSPLSPSSSSSPTSSRRTSARSPWSSTTRAPRSKPSSRSAPRRSSRKRRWSRSISPSRSSRSKRRSRSRSRGLSARSFLR